MTVFFSAINKWSGMKSRAVRSLQRFTSTNTHATVASAIMRLLHTKKSVSPLSRRRDPTRIPFIIWLACLTYLLNIISLFSRFHSLSHSLFLSRLLASFIPLVRADAFVGSPFASLRLKNLCMNCIWATWSCIMLVVIATCPSFMSHCAGHRRRRRRRHSLCIINNKQIRTLSLILCVCFFFSCWCASSRCSGWKNAGASGVRRAAYHRPRRLPIYMCTINVWFLNTRVHDTTIFFPFSARALIRQIFILDNFNFFYIKACVKRIIRMNVCAEWVCRASMHAKRWVTDRVSQQARRTESTSSPPRAPLVLRSTFYTCMCNINMYF